MKLFLECNRTGYSPDQIKRTMTVGELKRFLEDYDDDMPIYTTHDRRYTYGAILERDFEVEEDICDNCGTTVEYGECPRCADEDETGE